MSNRKFSADVLGRIESYTENTLKELNTNGYQPTMLFINGALGDVSPLYGGVEGMNKMAGIFNTEFTKALTRLELVNPIWRVQTKEVYLGNPGLSVYNCSRKNLIGKFIRWTRFLRRKRLSLRPWLPKKEKVSLIQLGNILFMTWPGEPTTDLGFKLKELAFKKADYAWIMGLTNNHLAYFVTKEEESAATKEACNSFYSSKASYKIIDSFSEMLNTL